MLRALAQQEHKPDYVIDEQADGLTQVQRYVNKDFDLVDGKTHETGVQDALADTAVAMLFHEYLQSGVIPPISVFTHAESHLYCVTTALSSGNGKTRQIGT
jgi:hypothetical protein